MGKSKSGGGGKSAKKGGAGGGKKAKVGQKKKGFGGLTGAAKKERSFGGEVFDPRAPATVLAPGATRRDIREAAREAELRRKAQQGVRKKHGGEIVVLETRQRLKAKVVERQLKRLTVPAERCAALRELGMLNAEAGRTKLAIENFKEIILNMPEDPDFARTQLLCLYMENTKVAEASELVLGPLFAPLHRDSLGSAQNRKAKTDAKFDYAAASEPPPKGESPGERVATLVGCYTLALLTYLQVQGSSKATAEGERRLLARLRRAHALNPFCTELITFLPAFEPHFPEGTGLPEFEACSSAEEPLRDALEYACRLGQVAMWSSADDEVRRYLRHLLFEDDPAPADAADGEGGEEKPPFAPLPDPPTGDKSESDLLVRWRRARADAMELWAAEMSVEGGSDNECEGGEEEIVEEGEEEEMDSDDAFDEAEDRRHG